MSGDTSALATPTAHALLRWRLALGPAAEKRASVIRPGGLGGGAAGLARRPRRASPSSTRRCRSSTTRNAALASAVRRPYMPKWLAGLREFFRHDVVALVQKDAIERKGLTQLLFEPETLPFLEKNVELVATLHCARAA